MRLLTESSRGVGAAWPVDAIRGRAAMWQEEKAALDKETPPAA